MLVEAHCFGLYRNVIPLISPRVIKYYNVINNGLLND